MPERIETIESERDIINYHLCDRIIEKPGQPAPDSMEVFAMQFLRYTLYVNDINTSVRFYEEVVGFPVIRRFSRPGVELAFLGDEETRVELIQGKVGQCFCKSASVGYPVENLEQKMASVRSCGVSVHGETLTDITTRSFCVADPDGILVQFVEKQV